jgi:ATP-binding cassette subfamily B protein
METQVMEKAENPLMYLFRKSWQNAENRKKNIVAYWVMFAVGNAIVLVLHPWLLTQIIKILQAEGVTQGNYPRLVKLLIEIVGASALFWIFHGPGRAIERSSAFKTRASYSKKMILGVLYLPLDWHAEHHTGDTADKMEKGRTGLYAFASETFQPILVGVRLIVCYCMLTNFSVAAGLIFISMIVLTATVSIRFDRKILANYRILNGMDNKISAAIADVVNSITTVIILRVENVVYNLIAKKIDEPYKLYLRTTYINEWKWFVVSSSGPLTSAAVLATFFWMNIGTGPGVILASTFMLMKYLDEMSDLYQRFADIYGEVMQRQARVLNAEEIVKDFQPVRAVPLPICPDWKRVEIRGLNFTYRNAEGKILHLRDINISFERGERIACVGESGSGKTTFLKVLRALHTAESCEVYVDGKLLEGGLERLSNETSLVPQKPEIFKTDIRENVTCGAEVSDATVAEYLELACFTSVLKKLPKGLDTSVQEKGVNLSGGQNQRLALARSLMACGNRSIILLDEPTSSVDVINEGKICTNIFRKFHQSTTILSTHQRYLLPYCDRIYMFKEGRIVGCGTVEELLETCPEFKELWENDTGDKEKD